jgi:hypothetical protein
LPNNLPDIRRRAHTLKMTADDNEWIAGHQPDAMAERTTAS